MSDRVHTWVRTIAVLLLLPIAVLATVEQHKTRLDVEANGAHIDLGTAAVHELRRAVAPKSDHAICPAHDGHPEVDLGVPVACPKAEDGMCVRGDLPLSVAQSRCQAGKL